MKVLSSQMYQGVIMRLSKIFKNAILVTLACLALSACATKKVSTGGFDRKGSKLVKLTQMSSNFETYTNVVQF